MRTPCLTLALLALSLFALSATAQQTIDVASGLTIRQIADDDLMPDCTALAVDAMGRVVASGPGYIRMLVDEDEDGSFERYHTILDGPSHGAHGLCFDGKSLFYVGDNGVWRISDTNDAKPARVLEIKTGGEHDAHAIRKGPDGHWYLIAGNATKGMYDLQNVSRPVIPNPRAGAIWRISPDWSERMVWAHGFRNAYDFDFAPAHAIDTFDSDGERDVSLPWYRPTRVFRVREGNDAGWMTRSWKRPNVDPQMPQVLAELGRGSPTGVLRYRHKRLPDRFHQGVFVLDWTFGRVIFVADDGRTEVVAQPGGTTGFAATDIESLPDGRLIVSVGGRRSRGGLYIIDAVDPSSEHSQPRPLWSAERPTIPQNETRQSIAKLRSQSMREIDHEAVDHAVEILHRSRDRDELIGAMILLAESIGGLGEGDPKDARGKQQAAAVFDAYRSRLRPKLAASTIENASAALIRILKNASSDDQLSDESIRALAVIEPNSNAAFAAIADEMDRVESPIRKLHRLIALARLPVSRSDDMTDQVAHAMLNIPVRVDELGLKVDRNWTPRLAELFVAMEHRDSLLPSRLVSLPAFGHRSHLVWTERMDPENLERARKKCLRKYSSREIDPTVARFIALGSDAVPIPHIRRWLKEPTTQSSAWLAIANHPQPSDVEELRTAALSVDKTVREAAERALGQLGEEIPIRESTAESTQRWLEKMDSIVQLDGDATRGKTLFSVRQCAACHNGAKALGPSLEGISKRFSKEDLYRATVDPNHTISDRYRARKVLTDDGRVLVGMPIYESVDGVTLMTADVKMLRINADSIEDIRPASNSLMPEGLIDGLTDDEFAHLLVYMRSL